MKFTFHQPGDHKIHTDVFVHVFMCSTARSETPLLSLSRTQSFFLFCIFLGITVPCCQPILNTGMHLVQSCKACADMHEALWRFKLSGKLILCPEISGVVLNFGTFVAPPKMLWSYQILSHPMKYITAKYLHKRRVKPWRLRAGNHLAFVCQVGLQQFLK